MEYNTGRGGLGALQGAAEAGLKPEANRGPGEPGRRSRGSVTWIYKWLREERASDG